MKLSEAIRKGVELVPGQAVLYYYADWNNTACVLGHAYIGINGFVPNHAILEHTPEARQLYNTILYFTGINDTDRIPDPRSDREGQSDYVLKIAFYLNDIEHWSSLKTADYLESQGY